MYQRLNSFLRSIVGNKLFSGSILILVGSTLSNAGNYLYHLFMGRMLGPADYGLLASLISLTYMISVPIGTIRLSLVKEISSFYKKNSEIKKTYDWILAKSIPVYILLALLAIPLSSVISKSINIGHTDLVFVMLISGIVGLYTTINQSFLQGMQEFFKLSVVGILGSATKLILALALVVLGYGVFGATSSFLVTSLIVGVVTYICLKKLLKSGERKRFRPKIKLSSVILPIFLLNLAYTSLYSTDIILAKRFLSASDAGFYAALSTLGKIIFFAISPIITVMFPITAEKHSGGGNHKKVFRLSLMFVVFICLGLFLIYLFFPKTMVLALYGKGYLPIIKYLKYFALIFSLSSISYLLINYFVSIKKTKSVILYALAAVVQVVAIYLFHESLMQLAIVSLAVMIWLLFSLVGYYFYNEKRES